MASKATTTSAQPGSQTMVSTFSPMRMMVETEPPRCDMPWISETFTSRPAAEAVMASTLPARMVPWPPTPTSRTVLVWSSSTRWPTLTVALSFVAIACAMA